jgi:hypothetical protein
MDEIKAGAVPRESDLGKISFNGVAIGQQHLAPFKSITPDDLLPTNLQRLMSNYVGMNLEIFQAWTFILPIYAVFESIYMRAATKHRYTKAPKNNKGYPEIGTVPLDKFMVIYRDFRTEFGNETGLVCFDEKVAMMDNYGLGNRAARRFYNYFTGQKLVEGLPKSPDDDEFKFPTKKLGSCANILGCTFNITPVGQYLEGNRELLTHQEHSRPYSNLESKPDQKMCAPHNGYKSDNKIFDVFRLYYCATGKNLR